MPDWRRIPRDAGRQLRAFSAGDAGLQPELLVDAVPSRGRGEDGGDEAYDVGHGTSAVSVFGGRFWKHNGQVGISYSGQYPEKGLFQRLMERLRGIAAGPGTFVTPSSPTPDGKSGGDQGKSWVGAAHGCLYSPAGKYQQEAIRGHPSRGERVDVGDSTIALERERVSSRSFGLSNFRSFARQNRGLELACLEGAKGVGFVVVIASVG
jgi:hypothetical protein